MQTALMRALSRRGFVVTSCTDGAQVVGQWLHTHPHVVVLDLSLPGLDGLQVLAQARSQGLVAPVLILTARGTVGDRIAGLNHDADDYLAVLKVRVQSALRGDHDALDALSDINQTVDRATVLANQMLGLAKVEQLRQQSGSPHPGLARTVIDLASIVRSVALDLAPLMADRDLVFDIETTHAGVACHEWMLGELTRNLLHNAIKYTPHGGALSVRVQVSGEDAVLSISDSAPGVTDELAKRLFQPFSAGRSGAHGSGLGLAICFEITQALGGTITLTNRPANPAASPHDTAAASGLDAVAILPLASLSATA